MKQVLRPYQVNALEGVSAAFRQGHKKVLLCIPTGGGKTTVAASIIEGAKAKGNSVIFGAHRRPLVSQCVARLQEFDIHPDIIMAGHAQSPYGSSVSVASIPTLNNRKMPKCKLLIIDEAHHATAGSFMKVIDRAVEMGAYVLGLTATPYRLDGTSLSDMFDVIVLPTSIKELTDLGNLVPVRYIGPIVEGLDGMKKVAGDFDKKQLQAAFDRAELYDRCFENYKTFSDGKRAIVFNVNIEHSKHTMERFRGSGVSCGHIDSTMSVAEVERVLQDFKTGQMDMMERNKRIM